MLTDAYGLAISTPSTEAAVAFNHIRLLLALAARYPAPVGQRIGYAEATRPFPHCSSEGKKAEASPFGVY
jgi:hypothetical protein